MYVAEAPFHMRVDGTVRDQETGLALGRVAVHMDGKRLVFFSLDRDERILGMSGLRDVAALRVIREALPGRVVTLLDLRADPWLA
jgi:hypothetical protein